MAPAQGLAPTSTRTLWKGAITFGLVHIPIGLYSATAESGIDFDQDDPGTINATRERQSRRAHPGAEIDDAFSRTCRTGRRQ